MSSMQNYLSSRSPCGNQGCDDKPTDGDIRHKGRVHDKKAARKAIEAEAGPDESWDMSSLREGPVERWSPEYYAEPAPFTTETPA